MTLRATRPTAADLPDGYQFGDVLFAGEPTSTGERIRRAAAQNWTEPYEVTVTTHRHDCALPFDFCNCGVDPQHRIRPIMLFSPCLCPDYLTGRREVPIGAVIRCPVHQERTFHRGPAGDTL